MKIFCLTPWTWKSDFDWFRRDLGLLANALSERGHVAKLLLHRAAEMPPDSANLLGVEPDLLKDTEFWRAQAPGLVITLAGSRPSEFLVNNAIRSAGIPLWNRMDSDGVFGSSIEPWLSVYGYWWRGKSNGHVFPWLRSLAIHAYRALIPSRGDELAIRLLEPCSRILQESPIAVARMQRFFVQQGRNDLAERIVWFPGVIPDDRKYSSSPKQNIVLAIGRWTDFMQKDTPKAIRVLRRFLAAHPDYRAKIVGAFDERLDFLLKAIPPAILSRIEVTGRLPSEELTKLYETAKICLFTSRGEGFPNVGGEALCCGCSIVGPAQIASMHYFASACSGTLSWSRTDNAILDALSAEALEWKRENRDPGSISNHFRAEICASAAAKRVEEIFRGS